MQATAASPQLQLGCSRCRYAAGGCTRCRAPGFKPRGARGAPLGTHCTKAPGAAAARPLPQHLCAPAAGRKRIQSPAQGIAEPPGIDGPSKRPRGVPAPPQQPSSSLERGSQGPARPPRSQQKEQVQHLDAMQTPSLRQGQGPQSQAGGGTGTGLARTHERGDKPAPGGDASPCGGEASALAPGSGDLCAAPAPAPAPAPVPANGFIRLLQQRMAAVQQARAQPVSQQQLSPLLAPKVRRRRALAGGSSRSNSQEPGASVDGTDGDGDGAAPCSGAAMPRGGARAGARGHSTSASFGEESPATRQLLAAAASPSPAGGSPVASPGPSPGGASGSSSRDDSAQAGGKKQQSRRIGPKRGLYEHLRGPGDPSPRLCLWEPPVSPYGLIEEELFQDPWRLLLACMLLNKTSCKQVRGARGSCAPAMRAASDLAPTSPPRRGPSLKPAERSRGDPGLLRDGRAQRRTHSPCLHSGRDPPGPPGDLGPVRAMPHTRGRRRRQPGRHPRPRPAARAL
jgi:hypothetical protein